MRALRPPAFAALLSLSLLATGCATRTSTPSPQPAVAPRPPPAAIAMSAAAYVAAASSLDLFIIRASELAQQRTTALRVREVASRLVSSRQGTSQQLSFAGRRLDLLPSATLGATERARLDRLRTASDFDFQYRREIGAALADALKLHSAYAEAGASATLRPVAEMAAEVTRRDLRLIGYL